MKTALLILLITFFMILFISYPFKIKWSFHFNVLKNVGFVVFKVLFIRLTCERFKINNKCEIEIESEKKKKKDDQFLKQYIYSLAKRVDVKRIDLFCDIGLKDDAYLLSMTCGYIDSFFNICYSVLLNRYVDLKIFYRCEPTYQRECLEATGKIIVTFSLIDVLISVYNAYRRYKRLNKGGL